MLAEIGACRFVEIGWRKGVSDYSRTQSGVGDSNPCMALTPLRMLEDLVLQAVTELGGSATPQQVIDRIQAMEGFTPTSVDLTRHPGPDGPPAWHSRVRQRWPARSLRKQLHRQEFSYVIRQILAKASSSSGGKPTSDNR